MILTAAVAVGLVLHQKAVARDVEPREPAPQRVVWVKVTGTGEAWVRLDAVDVIRLSETSSNRGEMFAVAAGKLKSIGIVKDDELARLRPALAPWVKVGNNGLVVNPQRITSVAFDQTVSFSGKRATVYVTELFPVGTAQNAQEIAELEALVRK